MGTYLGHPVIRFQWRTHSSAGSPGGRRCSLAYRLWCNLRSSVLRLKARNSLISRQVPRPGSSAQVRAEQAGVGRTNQPRCWPAAPRAGFGTGIATQ